MFILIRTLNISKIKCVRLLIILIILLSACGQPVAFPESSPIDYTPEPTVDPWIAAVEDADQLLRANPGFEINIFSYMDIAREINQHLELVEDTRPALNIIDDLKNTEIPFMGNAWDALIEVLDSSYPGSGQALIFVDSGLRQILEFKGKLDSLEVLVPVASASETFRAAPSSDHLRTLENSIVTGKTALIDIDQELVNQLNTLNDYLDSVSLVQSGLALVVGSSDIPVVGEAITSLNSGINDLINPVRSVQNSGEQLHNHIQSDLAVMESIQEIVYQANNPPPQGGRSPERRSDSPLSSDFGAWLPVLLVVFLAAIGLVGFMIWRSRATKAEPVRLQSVPSFSPPVSQTLKQQETPVRPVVAQEPKVRQARLEFSHGKLSGQLRILSKDNILIGRGSKCDVRVPDRTVSRQHARFRYADRVWFIQDQNSTGGTFVNGNRVQASRLKSGDVIKIGDTKFKFQEL